MKKMITTGFMILLYVVSYSQNLDLVVTTSGDSVACKIDSVSESRIFLQIKTTNSKKWTYTYQQKDSILRFEYDCINPKQYIFKDGTSVIIQPKPEYPVKFPAKDQLEKASQKELVNYLAAAKKTKKTGKTITAVGAGIFLTGCVLLVADKETAAYAGGALGLIGLGVTLVGLPVLITGSSRIKNINAIKKSRGMTMELVPTGFYSFQAKGFQPGATLRIKF